ncbi:MAG: ComEC/Rec2 family competence protein [Brevinema sp.]
MRTNVVVRAFPDLTPEGIVLHMGTIIVHMPYYDDIAFGSQLHLKGKFYPRSKSFYAEEVKVIHPSSFLWQRISSWRLSAQKKVRDVFDSRSSGLILALSFGNKEFLDPLFAEYIRSAGMSHFMALSGLHVGLIAGFIFWILIQLGVRRQFAPLVALPFSMGYLLLGGIRVSLMRAVLFHVFWAFNASFRWHLHPAMVLVISFIILLILGMGGLSLMMSIMAVAGIIFLSGFWDERLSSFFGNYWGGVISISLAATLGVLPIVLFFFKEINVLFLLPNLVIIPLSQIIIFLCILAALFPLPIWEKAVLGVYRIMETTCQLIAEMPYSLLRVSSRMTIAILGVIFLTFIIKKYIIHRRVRNGF